VKKGKGAGPSNVVPEMLKSANGDGDDIGGNTYTAGAAIAAPYSVHYITHSIYKV